MCCRFERCTVRKYSLKFQNIKYITESTWNLVSQMTGFKLNLLLVFSRTIHDTFTILAHVFMNTFNFSRFLNDFKITLQGHLKATTLYYNCILIQQHHFKIIETYRNLVSMPVCFAHTAPMYNVSSLYLLTIMPKTRVFRLAEQKLSFPNYPRLQCLIHAPSWTFELLQP